MDRSQIKEFLKNNDMALQILNSIRNEMILGKLTNGVNPMISNHDVSKNIKELKTIPNLKKELRVLGRMGLLEMTASTGDFRRGNVKQFWTISPLMSDILNEMKQEDEVTKPN